MNNKEFISELSSRLNLGNEEVQKMVTSFTDEVTDALQNGDVVMLSSFGTFEVKKKTERVVVNPITRKTMLVPPKLAMVFKPSTQLKEKMK